jgi:hypothetical protein
MTPDGQDGPNEHGRPPLPVLQGDPPSEWTAPVTAREWWSLPLLAVVIALGLAWAVRVWGRGLGLLP